MAQHTITDIMDALDLIPDDPRPMARTRGARLDAGTIARVIARAARNGYAWYAGHGGTVANSYGYPASTTAVAVVAVRVDPTHVRVATGSVAIPANKATAAGAIGAATRVSGRGAWWTLAAGRTPRDTSTERLTSEMTHPITVTVHRSGLGQVALGTRRAGYAILPAQHRKTVDRISRLTLRDYARRYTRQGYAVEVARQSTAQIAAGAGPREYTPGGELVLILTHGGGHYHMSRYTTPALAVAAIEERRANEERMRTRREYLDTLLASPAGGRILVTVADSLGAGHCAQGTESARQELERRLRQQWPGLRSLKALRVASLFALRDDPFTRRAARVAALRTGIGQEV